MQRALPEESGRTGLLSRVLKHEYWFSGSTSSPETRQRQTGRLWSDTLKLQLASAGPSRVHLPCAFPAPRAKHHGGVSSRVPSWHVSDSLSPLRPQTPRDSPRCPHTGSLGALKINAPGGRHLPAGHGSQGVNSSPSFPGGLCGGRAVHAGNGRPWRSGMNCCLPEDAQQEWAGRPV